MISPEFYLSTCVIPDLTKKISTVRSRNISMSLIFQNLAQMQNRYPNNQWAEIIGGCDIQLFLGCTDDITARYISDRTGEITIGVSSESKHLSTFRMTNYTPQYRETSSVGRRKLMTPDEVLRLDIKKAIVICRGEKILLVDKYDYTKHPESKKLIMYDIKNHKPKWMLEKDKELNKTLESTEKSTEVNLERSDSKIKNNAVITKDNDNTKNISAESLMSIMDEQ